MKASFTSVSKVAFDRWVRFYPRKLVTDNFNTGKITYNDFRVGKYPKSVVAYFLVDDAGDQTKWYISVYPKGVHPEYQRNEVNVSVIPFRDLLDNIRDIAAVQQVSSERARLNAIYNSVVRYSKVFDASEGAWTAGGKIELLPISAEEFKS